MKVESIGLMRNNKFESYRPPWYLFNGHLQTIVPFWLDKAENDLYETERLELEDEDFLDIDWIKNDKKRLMIISHGLEGNSRSYYVKQSAKHFATKGWDILAWNFRGCSREPNRLPKFYHAGETQDISSVVQHALKSAYKEIVLVGFSIGASMTINYAGTTNLDDTIKAICTFSVPLDIKDSSNQLDRNSRGIYRKNFIEKLKRKVRKMSHDHPELKKVDLEPIKTFNDFNAHIAAPFHGFNSLEELYQSGNCLKNLAHIQIPTLIVNAKNDPILGDKSYPQNIGNQKVTFVSPEHGGHAGFTLSGKPEGWMALSAEAFLGTNLSLVEKSQDKA